MAKIKIEIVIYWLNIVKISVPGYWSNMESFLVYLFNFYYAISELEQNKQNNTIIFFFTIYFFNKKVDLSSLRGGAGALIASPLPTGLGWGAKKDRRKGLWKRLLCRPGYLCLCVKSSESLWKTICTLYVNVFHLHVHFQKKFCMRCFVNIRHIPKLMENNSWGQMVPIYPFVYFFISALRNDSATTRM